MLWLALPYAAIAAIGLAAYALSRTEAQDARSLVLAGVLIAFAAYGLSQNLVNDDYCITGRSARTWRPPGFTCEGDWTGWVPETTANAWAISTNLGAGLLLVLKRRSKLAVASSLIFATAAAGAVFVSPVVLIFTGWIFGGPMALWATRSIAATALPMLALLIAYTTQFFGDIPWAWSAALLALALIPRPLGEAWPITFRFTAPEPFEPRRNQS